MEVEGSVGDFTAFVKKHPRYVDEEKCIGCGICVDNCPTAALSIGPDEIAKVDGNRCIGCGVCMSHCETEAINLNLKPEETRACERLDSMQLGMKLTKLRGKTLVPLFSEKTNN